MKRRVYCPPLLMYALAVISGITGCATAPRDPLPSWNDTGPKKAAISFVEKVTREGSADFVPVPERIAVFDNDGTLWAARLLASDTSLDSSN